MLTTEAEREPTMPFRSHLIRSREDESNTADAVFREALAPRIKIIVADDERIIANTLTLILNRSGFEAHAVYSGEAAIEALGTCKPDILISDVSMPGMGGIEAAIAVRTLQPNVKILLFSAQAATEDLLQDARAHGHNFEMIAKPVHPVDLLAKLRAAKVQ